MRPNNRDGMPRHCGTSQNFQSGTCKHIGPPAADLVRRRTTGHHFIGFGSTGRHRQFVWSGKAALVHMAKGLARQYACKKIRVNVVSPGTVYFKGGVWNMVEQNMPKRYKEALARNPTGRMATPQEIANAAVFLASPATSFTTGSNLIVDGAISNRVNF